MPVIPDDEVDDEGDGEDFHDVDSNLETAFKAWELYEAESRDREARDSCVMDLRLPDDDSDLRPPLPNFNDERWPQDSREGTFRGTRVELKHLVDGEVDWDDVFAGLDGPGDPE